MNTRSIKRISKPLVLALFGLNLLTCGIQNQAQAAERYPHVIVLGTAQDGGYPQAGCQRECCQRAWRDPAKRRFVSCLAIVDPTSGERWLLDCTPDFRDQLRLLDELTPALAGRPLTGIFPTHAHVGHYAGLIHLGREVMGKQWYSGLLHATHEVLLGNQWSLESASPVEANSDSAFVSRESGEAE